MVPVGGLLSLAAGIILIIYPGISIVILPFVVGFTLLFLSFLLMGFSFEMKNLGILNWVCCYIKCVGSYSFFHAYCKSSYFRNFPGNDHWSFIYYYWGIFDSSLH